MNHRLQPVSQHLRNYLDRSVDNTYLFVITYDQRLIFLISAMAALLIHAIFDHPVCGWGRVVLIVNRQVGEVIVRERRRGVVVWL